VTSTSGTVSSFIGLGLAALLLAALAGCASATGGDGLDGGGGDDDVDSGTPPGMPDATPGTADAPPGAPDAYVPLPPDANVPLPPDANTGTPCSTGAVCSGAMTLPSISGDTNAQKQIAQGYQSAWFKIRVTEDDSGIFGVSTSAQVKLTSPVGTDFDVFVYLNPGSDVAQECSMLYGDKTTSGNVETILADWGESNGGLSNGNNDGRTMSIEIRPASGTCSVGQVWQLEVTGNQ
jgi:hypothetical protein